MDVVVRDKFAFFTNLRYTNDHLLSMPIEVRPAQEPRPMPSPEVPKIAKRSSETLTNGKEIFSRMLSMIGGAKHSIDLQFYTFDADATGKKVLNALAEAKRRNPQLSIRLLMDNSLSFHNLNGNSEEIKRIRDETYHIVNQMTTDGILDAKVTNWFPHNPLFISNVIHRDHKKGVFIDALDPDKHPDAHPMALVTSANVAAYHEYERKEIGRVYHGADGPMPYLERDFNNSFNHAKEWEHVYSVQSFGEYVQRNGILGKTFNRDLIGFIVRNPQAPGERMQFTPGPKGHDEAVLTDSFWGEAISRPFEKLFGKKIGAREATNEAFSMLDLAQKNEKVIIFSPYPGMISLTRHLKQAAQRGVEVHLIIAQNYEKELYNPKHLKLWQRPLKAFFDRWPKQLTKGGVILHEYTGEKEGYKGELHAKGALWIRTDGSVRTLIGSTNFSKGPVGGMNRELAVVEESDMSDPMVTYAYDLMADAKIYTLPATRRGR